MRENKQHKTTTIWQKKQQKTIWQKKTIFGTMQEVARRQQTKQKPKQTQAIVERDRDGPWRPFECEDVSGFHVKAVPRRENVRAHLPKEAKRIE